MKSFAAPRPGMKPGINLGMMMTVGTLSITLALPGTYSTVLGQGEPSPVVLESKAQAAIDAGKQALNEARWQEAVNQFSTALGLLPDSTEASQGLEQAQAMLNQDTTSQDVAQTREQQRQRAIVEFDESYNIANERLREGNFEGASSEILIAKVKLEARRDFLQEAEYVEMSNRAETLTAAIDEARIVDELRRQKQAQEEADRAKLEEARRQDRLREDQIDQSLRRVRQLQMELKYPEALQVIDEILFIDDLNPAALALRDTIQSTMMYRDYSEIQRRKEFGLSVQRNEVQESMVVPQVNFSGPGDKSTSALMTYPADWPQVSIMRGTGSGSFQETPQNRAVWQRLQETRIPVDFTNNTFDQVQGFLEQVTGLNIYVDWKALDLVGIDKETEVNLKLQEVNAATALERVLEQLGEGDQRPRFDVQDGILTVSSDEAMRKRVFLQVYDIRDLLFQVPVFDNAPELDLDSALNQGQGGGGGGSGGGGGGGLGGGGGGGGGGSGGGGGGGGIFGSPGEEAPRLTREELVAQIVDIIQENIDPDGWRDLGGDTGSLQELNGNLIITNTPTNHRGIDGLLAQLREIRALQINVESRFLTVATDWFEKIGIDLDLYFNTNDDVFDAAKAVDPNFQLGDFFNNDGSVKDPLVFGGVNQITPNGFINTVPTGALIGVPDATGQGIQYLIPPVGAPIRTTDGFAPIGIQQNHNNLIDSLADFDIGSFAGLAAANPALSVGIQFLDDIQVDLLIEATQADKRSVVLTAPRLTFFNGQRAWVAVTTQIAFVSALTAVTGDSSGAFQPEVDTLSDGFVLDVEGVISADRRYVTMTVIFDFAEFLGFRQSDAAEVSGSAGGGGEGGGDAAEFTGFVELPQLRVSQIRTTVSVPDKGTVLLGGQRHVEEIEVESGIPMLSKIPFVNRFFTNRVTSKTEQTLLILIRPEIIIQQENEDLLFPGLTDSLGSGGAYIR